MKKLKQATVMTIAVGGLVAAGAGVASADAGAEGAAVGSPGVVSGNNAQVPVHVPVNVCANSVNAVIGILNPTFGNVCVNK